MGCIKLDILDEQYKKPELKVSYHKKELTQNFFAVNERSETVLYYFEARYYDPHSAVFTARDVYFEKNFWVSPYSYCKNNPLNRIDPDGNDDYFCSEGKYLYTDDKKTDFIKIVHPTRTNIDGVDAVTGETPPNIITPIEDTKLSASAITNIVNHYNNQLNEEEGKALDLKIETGSFPYSPRTLMEHSTGWSLFGKKIGSDKITVNYMGGEVTKILNTASNIKNTLVHERKHNKDANLNYHVGNSAKRELRAIEAQKQHSSYQTTTEAYKKSVERYENQNKRRQ